MNVFSDPKPHSQANRNIKRDCNGFVSTLHLAWWGAAGLWVMWGTVCKEGVQTVCWPTVGIHSQFLSKSLFLPPVGKPVVDSHLRDQVGAKPVSFGWRYSSLEALSPECSQGKHINIPGINMRK